MVERARLVVRAKSLPAVQAGHPWIMAESLVVPAATPNCGEVVDLVGLDGKLIAKGLFNPAGRIAVRTFGVGFEFEIDESFILERVRQAFKLRRESNRLKSLSAVRLVNSEGDGLSGLVIDRYGDTVVVQQTAAVLTQWMESIFRLVDDELHPVRILHVIDEPTAKLEGIQPVRVWVRGDEPTEPIEIDENGVRIQIQFSESQKTGYYLDQRDNRAWAAEWVPPNAQVLDVCCYLGGFSIAIAKHHPTSKVLGIDTSLRTIESAKNNAVLNGVENVEFEKGDFIETLQGFVEEQRRFDMIVLDPPKLAGSKAGLDRALRAYHRLNFLAVKLLNPGGILVTCSCSGRVSRAEFSKVLFGVSKRSRRTIQVLEQHGAAPDHPISTLCPETEYLKCFICRVL